MPSIWYDMQKSFGHDPTQDFRNGLTAHAGQIKLFHKR
ncbi:hypothetical protein HNQ78_000183 [Phycisphaera mikurensis]|nr:hypothetical protein [Phycisphaera mikurensis]